MQGIGSKPLDNRPKIGGGRIIGEVCHFIDLLSFLLSSTKLEQNFTIWDIR